MLILRCPTTSDNQKKGAESEESLKNNLTIIATRREGAGKINPDPKVEKMY